MAEPLQWVLRALVAIVFVGMGLNHFRYRPARVMARMIPPALRSPRLPSPQALVRLTGVCEVAGGVGILLPATRPLAAAALVVFLIAVFPANVYAAEHPDRFGRLAVPFWPRFAGQLALILLVILAAV